MPNFYPFLLHIFSVYGTVSLHIFEPVSSGLVKIHFYSVFIRTPPQAYPKNPFFFFPASQATPQHFYVDIGMFK
jgi:hypothetical protein